MPRGLHETYVSDQLCRAYAGSAFGRAGSFHQISVSSLYRVTYWSRALPSSSHASRFSFGVKAGGSNSFSSAAPSAPT